MSIRIRRSTTDDSPNFGVEIVHEIVVVPRPLRLELGQSLHVLAVDVEEEICFELARFVVNVTVVPDRGIELGSDELVKHEKRNSKNHDVPQ